VKVAETVEIIWQTRKISCSPENFVHKSKFHTQCHYFKLLKYETRGSTVTVLCISLKQCIKTFAVFWRMCVFFGVIPRRLKFICQRFGTLCLFHLLRLISMKNFFIPTRLWRWNRQSVPKRWHIKFRRRGITQKKAYKTPISLWCKWHKSLLLLR
jgi:hypothetical protein